MATFAEIKKLINKHYKKAKRKQARAFKEMWEDIYNLLSNKPLTEKPKEKKTSQSNSSEDKNLNVDISEIVKEAIKEEQEERKPVSQSGEIFCKHCRQNVYPEEYNASDNICYLCERERLDG